MKRNVVKLMVLLFILSGTAVAQSEVDDVYFVPTKKEKETETPASRLVETAKSVESESTVNNSINVVVRNSQGRQVDIDEYNRRYTSDKNDFSIENDTLYIDELPDSDLEGQWVNEFQGTRDDYEYAVRLIRFHDPAYAIPVGSPLYWDVVYGVGLFPSWDWNVYYDGMYAYVFPTYSNPLWWDWRYNSWGRWRWRWTYWSWYDPWWGWGYPYYAYYPHSHHHYHYWSGGGHLNHPTPLRSSLAGNRERWRGAASRTQTATMANGSTRGGNDRFNYGGRRPSNTNVANNQGGTNHTSNRVVQPVNTNSSIRQQYVDQARERFRVNGSTNNSSTTNTTRSTSRYVRPSTSRPRSMDYTRPSSTRQSTNYYRSTSESKQSTNYNRSSNVNSNSSSYNRSSSGSNRGTVSGGGSGNRGRR